MRIALSSSSFFPFPAPLGRHRHQECEVALCSSVLGCELLVPGRHRRRTSSSGQGGLRCAAPQWCLVQRSALGDCCSSGSGTEEDSLPGAPARHGRPFLCEALMVTRWRARRGGGGVLHAVSDLLYSFFLCIDIFLLIVDFRLIVVL